MIARRRNRLPLELSALTSGLLTLLLIALLATTGQVALAGTQGACDAGDNNKTKLYENKIGDTSDNNDMLWLCSGASNLGDGQWTHDHPGNCEDGSVFGSNDWNDCASSWTVFVGSNRRLCYYKDSGHNNLMQFHVGYIAGTRVNHPSGGNDKLSSVKITGSGVNCP